MTLVLMVLPTYIDDDILLSSDDSVIKNDQKLQQILESSAVHQPLLNISSNWRFASFSSPIPIMQKSQTDPSSRTFHASISPYLLDSSPPLPPNLSEGHTLPTPKIKNHITPKPSFNNSCLNNSHITSKYSPMALKVTLVSEQTSGFHPCLVTLHYPFPPSRQYFMHK